MDPKTEAQHRRSIANLFDEIAEHRAAIGDSSEAVRVMAREDRVLADKLDPPIVWQAGDMVRDKNGGIWRHDGSVWRSAGGGYAFVSDLPVLYGPIRKVYVSDPYEKQVVVSVDGLDPDHVAEWLKWAACNPEEEVCIRIAEAVRNQQAGSETGGDGA